MFHLFKNLISQKYFHYFEENLFTLLTKYILRFSFSIANSVALHHTHTSTPAPHAVDNLIKPLTKQQQIEIKSCVELMDKLVEQLTTTVCINHVVLCLCELLDITYQNQLSRTDYAINRTETQMANVNDSIIIQIYEVGYFNV
jgi:ATP/maltotriose-dependent transcriptional regulator MalT